ncbi:hypothetical protein D3C78_1271280 [compost metagenome]
MKQQSMNPTPLKVILHAPTASALERARNNAANLRRAAPGAEVRIIANAQAVAAALDASPHDQDAVTWLCPITLGRLDRECRTPLQLLDGPAVLEIALAQHHGWSYIRA